MDPCQGPSEQCEETSKMDSKTANLRGWLPYCKSRLWDSNGFHVSLGRSSRITTSGPSGNSSGFCVLWHVLNLFHYVSFIPPKISPTKCVYKIWSPNPTRSVFGGIFISPSIFADWSCNFYQHCQVMKVKSTGLYDLDCPSTWNWNCHWSIWGPKMGDSRTIGFNIELVELVWWFEATSISKAPFLVFFCWQGTCRHRNQGNFVSCPWALG